MDSLPASMSSVLGLQAYTTTLDFFGLFLSGKLLLCNSDWPGPPSVASGAPKLASILWPRPPELFWHYRCEPPCSLRLWEPNC